MPKTGEFDMSQVALQAIREEVITFFRKRLTSETNLTHHLTWGCKAYKMSNSEICPSFRLVARIQNMLIRYDVTFLTK